MGQPYICVGTYIKYFITLLLAGALLTAHQARADYSVTILHVNDLHSRILPIDRYNNTCSQSDLDEGKCYGGYARIANALKTRRLALNTAKQPNLTLHAGDDFEGSIFYAKYRGQASADLLNKMGFEAMALGNHEFDGGPGVLRRFIRKTNFPLVSANTHATRNSVLSDQIDPYVIIKKGGEKIGIIGAITPDTHELSNSGKDVEFTDPEIAINKALDALEIKGVNKIILLSHLGFSRDKEIAAKISDIDLIVGGHSKILLSNTDKNAIGPYPFIVENPDGKEVPIVQSGGYGKYYGEITLNFTDLGDLISFQGDSVLLNQSYEDDPAVRNRIERLSIHLKEVRDVGVGETTSVIDGTRKSCRTGECAMGNLVTDVMLWRMKKHGVNIAIQNGGGLRSSIGQGEVHWGDILTVLPFRNSIVLLKIKGRYIITALENGFSRADDLSGRFPQVAGLRVTWDPKARVGSRVVKVEVGTIETGFTTLELDEIYLVATNDYLLNGGDGYDVFKTDTIDSHSLGPRLEDAFADYFSIHSPITPSLQGRIILTE